MYHRVTVVMNSFEGELLTRVGEPGEDRADTFRRLLVQEGIRRKLVRFELTNPPPVNGAVPTKP